MILGLDNDHIHSEKKGAVKERNRMWEAIVMDLKVSNINWMKKKEKENTVAADRKDL